MDFLKPQEPVAGTPSEWLSPVEATCPLCEYSLRGLYNPQESVQRCPECGYQFEWAEVLDPARRQHPYLFEHHPNRNVWSFWKTVKGGLRPHEFWSSLHPAQRSRPGRLLVHWMLAASILLIAAAIPLGEAAYRFAQNQLQNRASLLNRINRGNARFGWNPSQAAQWNQVMTRRYGSLSAYAAQQFPITAGFIAKAMVERTGPLVLFLLTALAWPWMTFGALMIFQISMRRARIRKIHVLRCVLYSYDGLFWLGLALLAPAAMMLAVPWAPWLQLNQWAVGLAAALAAVAAFWMIFRLIVAYQLYLRFHEPAATVLAAQVIVSLFVIVVFAQIFI